MEALNEAFREVFSRDRQWRQRHQEPRDQPFNEAAFNRRFTTQWQRQQEPREHPTISGGVGYYARLRKAKEQTQHAQEEANKAAGRCNIPLPSASSQNSGGGGGKQKQKQNQNQQNKSRTATFTYSQSMPEYWMNSMMAEDLSRLLPHVNRLQVGTDYAFTPEMARTLSNLLLQYPQIEHLHMFGGGNGHKKTPISSGGVFVQQLNLPLLLNLRSLHLPTGWKEEEEEEEEYTTLRALADVLPDCRQLTTLDISSVVGRSYNVLAILQAMPSCSVQRLVLGERAYNKFLNNDCTNAIEECVAGSHLMAIDIVREQVHPNWLAPHTRDTSSRIEPAASAAGLQRVLAENKMRFILALVDEVQNGALPVRDLAFDVVAYVVESDKKRWENAFQDMFAD